MSWDRIVGHERVRASLSRAVDHDRPHHAYLLLGPRSVGKFTVARCLAAALACERTPRPCGLCGSCVRAAAGTHPDIFIEAPPSPGAVLPVEQITEMQRRLSFRVSGERFRSVIFEDATALTPVAQNKLLKTLEEPPPRTVIVLLALHPGQILQTVRSRCLKLVFGELPHASTAGWLVERHGAEPDAAMEAALRSGGLPGLALAHWKDGADELRVERATKMAAALAGERDAVAAVVEALERDKEAAIASLRLAQELLRDGALASLGVEDGLQHPVGPLGGRLAGWDAAALATLVDAADRALGAVRRQVAPAAVVEDFLLHLDRGALRT